MSDYYDKPKDWGVAPKDNWVSGTPIGQSEVRMPDLGDPGAHENVSERVSFGDDGPEASMNWRVAPGGKRVRPGEPCPPGTETKGGACVPSKNAAGLSPTAIKRQFKRDGDQEEGKGEAGATDPSLKRETPKAPVVDPQIRGLAKQGVEWRRGKQ